MAFRSWFRIRVSFLCALMLMLAATTHAAEADVRRVWQLLDYLAVDYGGAVKDGAVINASEFDEMREFAKTSETKLAALDPHPERAALVSEAQALAAAINAKKSPSEVAALAKSLANHLLAVYPVPSSPSAPPEVAKAAAIYQAQCAGCHGATGAGDGSAGLKLDPRPVAFTDKERARERSAFALYQVVSQGIEGTAMPGFPNMSEPDRWALAFYLGQFAHRTEDVAAGEKVWTNNVAVRAQLTSLDALSRITQADLAAQVGEEPAALAMAYLHAHPGAVVQNRTLSFDVARQKLTQSLQAVEKNDFGRATDLALSAYLDGVEPIEPTLATRDSALMGRIESAMGKYRSMLGAKSTMPELQAQVTDINALFKDADNLLGSQADATAAFLGSLTILLREGLEALLVVVAMIAFLRKAERGDMLRYVHAGWVGALALGHPCAVRQRDRRGARRGRRRRVAPVGGGLGEIAGDDRLAGAGRAGEQDAAAAEETASAQHGVEPGDAGGDALVRSLVIERERCDRQHADAVAANEEGKLVGAVERATVFHHAQMTRGDLVVDAVIEQDDAIGDVFLESVAGERFAAALGGDDGGDALVLEPAEESAQLGAEHGFVGQAGEKHLQGIKHDALGADGIDRVVEPDEQAFEVVFTACVGLAAFEVNVVEHDHFFPDELGEVEAHRGDIGSELGLGLFESEEHARFVELHGTAHEKFRGEERFAATGAAADEGRTTAGQSAAGDFIEALDAGGALGQRAGGGGAAGFGFHGRGGKLAVVSARGRTAVLSQGS